MISEGTVVRGKSLTKRKAYIKSIYSVEIEPKRPHSSLPVTLLDEKLKSIQTAHNDPVVVLVVIANFEVQKILVDSNSATNIMFYEIFQKMKLPSNRLILAKSPLYGCTGESIMPKGTITLPVLMGTYPK